MSAIPPSIVTFPFEAVIECRVEYAGCRRADDIPFFRIDVHSLRAFSMERDPFSSVWLLHLIGNLIIDLTAEATAHIGSSFSLRLFVPVRQLFDEDGLKGVVSRNAFLFSFRFLRK